MAIEDRKLKGGETLEAKYKGKAYICEVRKGKPDEGGMFGIEYVVDGKTFTSPSAAGSYVRDGKATNGWAFWSLEGSEKPVRVAKPKKAKAPASITEHREKKARVGKAVACGICGEKRKTAQALASHLRAHDRADAKAAAQPAQAEASV